MEFKSTNGIDQAKNFFQAAEVGLAKDRGLFVPSRWPVIDWASIENEISNNDGPKLFQLLANSILFPFVEDVLTKNQLIEINKRAFNFPIELVKISSDSYILELFHGPTAAFKDFGARFLAEVLQAMGKKKTVLVATSGDTGGAVASALDGKVGLNVLLLFPRGRVSELQKTQLTCWGENVQSFSVDGSFDDCQRMVKDAFSDKELQAKGFLTSANSINIARLLPQMTYYAFSAWTYQKATGKKLNYVIPTGNMGNAVAAIYARHLGCPIGRIVLSTNSNRTLSNFFRDGKYKETELEKTLANAMDVSSPSNFARYRCLSSEEHSSEIQTCVSVSDSQIRKTMATVFYSQSRVICPHTATAWHVRQGLDGGDWCIVSTAHPGKFKEIVEPVLGCEVALPKVLESLQHRKLSCLDITADSSAWISQFLRDVS